MTRLTRPRGRTLAAASATAGLVLTGLTLGGAPAVSAPPVEDCAVPTDISTLAKGDPVTGKTVSSGTTPDGFTGEVLGTIDNGIGIGVDMVIVDLSSDAIDAAGGIWAGMSGSPVYAEDGTLIGAVAYGLSWGPSPIAGVTPFADMDTYMTSAARHVAVSKTMARSIARHSDASVAQAQRGMHALNMGFGATGVSADRLASVKAYKARMKQAGAHPRWLSSKVYSVGRAGSSAAATEENLEAGGNLGAAVSTGDITFGAVGTVTSVCEGQVVGFGHPFTNAGEVTLGLLPADAVYVQPDSLGSPFKVANLGDAVGTVTDDHLTGITGTLGPVPDGADIATSISYEDRTRGADSTVLLDQAQPDVTFYQVLANHDSVLDAYIPGSEEQSWEITGTDENGDPFTLTYSDKLLSQYDIAFRASYGIADLLYSLGRIQDVVVDSVSVTADVSDDTSSLELAGLEQKVGGEWVKISRRKQAEVSPGDVLKVRALLEDSEGTITYVTQELQTSPKMREAYLSAFGGTESYLDIYGTKSVADVQEALAEATRGDQVGFYLYQYGRRFEKTTRANSASQLSVVSGYARASVGNGGSGGGVVECRGC